MARRIAGIVAVAAVVLVMAAGKVHFSGVREYRTARDHLEAGEAWQAIHSLDRTLHWYTPFSGYVRSAAADLWEIGQSAEARGDIRQALVAYRTLRSGFYAARSFYTPGRRWIARCDQRIIELAADEADFVRRNPDLDEARRREAIARSLAADRAPDVFWSVVVEVGFLGWVGCTIAFIWLVLGAKEGWRRRKAAVWGVLVFGFYALWIIGMMRA